MLEYGTTSSCYPLVVAKKITTTHLNPMAQFPFALNAEASKSGMASTPLRMLDCAPNSDGAAAVLCASDKAKKFTDKSIKISRL